MKRSVYGNKLVTHLLNNIRVNYLLLKFCYICIINFIRNHIVKTCFNCFVLIHCLKCSKIRYAVYFIYNQ